MVRYDGADNATLVWARFELKATDVVSLLRPFGVSLQKEHLSVRSRSCRVYGLSTFTSVFDITRLIVSSCIKPLPQLGASSIGYFVTQNTD